MGIQHTAAEIKDLSDFPGIPVADEPLEDVANFEPSYNGCVAICGWRKQETENPFP